MDRIDAVSRILVADDEKDIRDIVKLMLEKSGYEVVTAVDGRDAIDKFDDSVSLVVLDVMMPKCNGIDACAKIREKADVPILFLTAKSTESDLVEGFEAGGDDYLTKPFSSTELLVRIKALLKRPHIGNVKEQEDTKIIIQDLVMDTDLKQIFRDGVEIPLTEIEYRIIHMLATNRNHNFTAKEIYEYVWQEEFLPNSTNTVMVHIRNIRKKLGDTGPTPKYLHNSWGRGYRIV
ncbi:MAG: response regulator transcription factor [Lachnospiraceae bacterium]|nr:response regulator transcription factor [Lachnospiraceae bacterium]